VQSVEHAYQYKKALMNGRPDLAKQILSARTPWEAKSLSKYTQCSKTWEQTNTQLMTAAVTDKFNQIQEAQDALLATADKVIVEAVPGQMLWGSGMSQHATLNTASNAWPGENRLGKILMEVRDNMKKSEHRSRSQSRRNLTTHRSDSSTKRKLSDGSSNHQSPSRVRCLSLTGDKGRKPEYH
jgi:ribA/ribD-fused uncharacterized protein